jgi:hypothetical protein
MNQIAREILRRAANWPEEHQVELAQYAREIEARRLGVYVLTEEERAAIADARKSGIVSEDEMKEFWRRLGVT